MWPTWLLPRAPHERHVLARARRFAKFMHLPLVERLLRWNSIFQDDLAVPNEASGGVVDFIKIYKGALTAAEVRALEQAVPEPTTLLLTGFGLGTLAVTAWRRRESR